MKTNQAVTAIYTIMLLNNIKIINYTAVWETKKKIK